MKQNTAVANSNSWHFIKPDATHGFEISELVKRCPPLDINSTYCNLIQCEHFSQTCTTAINDRGDVIGFVSGYLIPERPYTIFIWQVAVEPVHRGKGLATEMLMDILRREHCRGVSFIETSITLPNRPSWTLFKKLADALHAPTETNILFDQRTHFNGQHETEMLMRIGPFEL